MSRISEENIDLFDQYLSDEMTAQVRMDFEARLSYDAEFKQELQYYKEIKKGIKTHYRQELKHKMNRADNELNKRKKRNRIRKIYITTVSVAASLALLFYFLPNNDNTFTNSEQLVAQFWPYEEGLPVKMSSKDKYDDAMNAFKQEQWEKTISLLEPIDSDTAYYFQGIAYYELEKYSMAHNYLQKVPKTSVYREEAQYRLALVTLITDKKKGKHMLLEISKSNSAFSSEAQEILKGL